MAVSYFKHDVFVPSDIFFLLETNWIGSTINIVLLTNFLHDNLSFPTLWFFLKMLWNSDSGCTRFLSRAPHSVSLSKANVNDVSENTNYPAEQTYREEKIAVYTIPAYVKSN